MVASRTLFAWLSATLLWVGTAVQSANATVIYDYTGNPFTLCTYGDCPADYTSDYIIASISFAAPLAPNLPFTNELSSVTAWRIGDALGYFSYSSTDPNAATELKSPTGLSLLPLALSTDGNGNIADYQMLAGDTGGIINPQYVDPTSQLHVSDFVEINYDTPAEWDASNSVPGQWNMVDAVPEPSTLFLTSLSGAILIIAIGRKRRMRAATQTTV